MIKFNMKKVLVQRGIARPYACLVNNGFAKSTASKILQGTITAPPDTLIEKFCLLFSCVPHDFIEWYPDSEEQAEKQPLKVLIPKGQNAGKLKNLLYQVPLDKYGDLIKKAEELAGKQV